MNIQSGDHSFIVINVFRVATDDQQRLVEILSRATDMSVRNVPGFIGAALHRGLEGTQVAVYAQWRSRADYEGMRSRAGSGSTLDEARAIATFEPGQYELVAVFGPPAVAA